MCIQEKVDQPFVDRPTEPRFVWVEDEYAPWPAKDLAYRILSRETAYLRMDNLPILKVEIPFLVEIGDRD